MWQNSEDDRETEMETERERERERERDTQQDDEGTDYKECALLERRDEDRYQYPIFAFLRAITFNFIYNRIPATFFGLVGVAVNHKLKLTSPEKAFGGAFVATELWRKARKDVIAPMAYIRNHSTMKELQETQSQQEIDSLKEFEDAGEYIEDSWWDYGRSWLYLHKTWRTLNPFDKAFSACQAGRVEAAECNESDVKPRSFVPW